MIMDQAGKFSSPLRRRAIGQQAKSRVVWAVSRAVWMLVACVLVAASGGCSVLQGVRDYAQYNDETDSFVVGWRNYVWANKAWHARKAYYAGEAQLHDFGEGFRAGYRDAAFGGNGCPPPLPPRKYWSWKYQTPEGQAKMAAWFSGYPHGARAAEEECAGNWRQIPVSHVIEQQYSAEFEQAQIPRRDGSNFPQPTDAPIPGQQGPAEPPPGPAPVPYNGQLPHPWTVPQGAAPVEVEQRPVSPTGYAQPLVPPDARSWNGWQGSVPTEERPWGGY
jgi:hypothetical protein